MKARFAVLLLPLLLGGEVCAQLRDTDTLRLGYTLTAQSSLATGNVDRWLMLGGAEVFGLGRAFGVKSSNDYRYGTFGGRVTENDWSSRNFVYWQPRKRIYPYAMALIEGLERRAISLRIQAGIGVTFVVVRRQSHVLRLSVTPVYESARYRTALFNRDDLGTDEQWASWRVTLRVAGQHQPVQPLRISYEFWLQPSVSRAADTRALSDVSLSWRLVSRFAVRMTHQLSYDQIVQLGRKQLDSFWLVGFQWGNL